MLKRTRDRAKGRSGKSRFLWYHYDTGKTRPLQTAVKKKDKNNQIDHSKRGFLRNHKALFQCSSFYVFKK